MSASAVIIATFDEYGEVLSCVVVPEATQDNIVHYSGDLDQIRTYAVDLEDPDEWNPDSDNIQNALDLLAEVHAIDAKKRSRRAQP